MEIITSNQNNQILHVKKLLTSKEYRHQNNQFIAEGWNLIKDIPSNAVIKVFVENSFNMDKQILAENIFVTKNVMKCISDTTTPQGIIAVCSMKKPEQISDGITVVLDNVQDPGNVGTIIRSAVACGVKDIVAFGSCADFFSPKVVRASMGGVFKINFIYTDDLGSLKKDIFVLDMSGDNLYGLQNYHGQNILLVVGSESQGISSAVKNLAKKVVSLPMCKEMESLNAGVSLSIALYHLTFGGI